MVSLFVGQLRVWNIGDIKVSLQLSSFDLSVPLCFFRMSLLPKVGCLGGEVPAGDRSSGEGAAYKGLVELY